MSSVVQYGAMVREHLNPFTATTYTTIAQPDGIPNNPGVNRVSFLSTLFLWICSLLFGPIAAHSLQAFTGYLLTAFVMFLFIRAVTRSYTAGLVAGLIYGFWPQMLGLGRAAPTYTHMWLLILPMWALWALVVNGVTRKRIVLAALSVVPAIFWTPYYAFHIFLVGAASLLVALLLLRTSMPLKKLALLAAAIGGTWILAYGLYYTVGMSTSAEDIPVRTAQEAYQQSASPLMYVLPGGYSFWGGFLNEYLVRNVPRALNTGLYLGISTLVLAGLALLSTRKKFDILKLRPPNLSLRAALYICALVALLCFAFSLPPTLTFHGHTIPTPNQAVITHVPALRAGQRLVMPIMAATVTLAAIGMYLISQKFAGRSKYIILLALGLIVIFDLWSPYPVTSTKVTTPESMAALRSQPDGRVAQYQAGSLVGYPAQTFCVMEMIHQKPIINDCGLGRSGIDPATPSKHLVNIIAEPVCSQMISLKKLHVRYVIVANDDREVLACYKDKPLLQDDTYHVFRLQ